MMHMYYRRVHNSAHSAQSRRVDWIPISHAEGLFVSHTVAFQIRLVRALAGEKARQHGRDLTQRSTSLNLILGMRDTYQARAHTSSSRTKPTRRNMVSLPMWISSRKAM